MSCWWGALCSFRPLCLGLKSRFPSCSKRSDNYDNYDHDDDNDDDDGDNGEVLDIQNSKCPLNHHHHHHAHLVGIDKRGVVDDGQAGREGGHVQVGTVDYGLLVVPAHS